MRALHVFGRGDEESSEAQQATQAGQGTGLIRYEPASTSMLLVYIWCTLRTTVAGQKALLKRCSTCCRGPAFVLGTLSVWTSRRWYCGTCMCHSNVKAIAVTHCSVPRVISTIQDKYSVFPLPASVMSASNGRTDEDSQSDVQAGKSIPGVVDHTSDTSWRPNFFTVRPEDRWKGLVDQFDQSPSLQNHENIGYGGQHSRDGRDTTTMCLPDKPSIEKENVAFSQSAQNIQGECCQPGERDKGAICEPAEGHAIWRGGDTGERSPSTAAEVAALVGNTLVCDSTNKMPNFAIRNKDEASFSEKTRRELRQLGAVAVEFPKGNVGHMKQSTEEGSWLEPGKVEAVLENLADRLRQIRKARLASEKHE